MVIAREKGGRGGVGGRDGEGVGEGMGGCMVTDGILTRGGEHTVQCAGDVSWNHAPVSFC